MSDWKSLLDLELALAKDDGVLDGLLALAKKMVTFRLITWYGKIKADPELTEKLEVIMKSNVLLDKRGELDQLLEFLGLKIDLMNAVCNIGCMEISNSEPLVDTGFIFGVFKAKLENIFKVETSESGTKPEAVPEKFVGDESEDKIVEEKLPALVSEQTLSTEPEDAFVKKELVTDLSEMIEEACDLDPSKSNLAGKQKKYSLSVDHILSTHKKTLNFSLIDIENCFFDFYQNNLYRKCEKCDNFPVRTDLCICLMCNYICCSGHCGADKEDHKGKNGNLVSHAYEDHGGCAVFANVFKGSMIYSEEGRYTISYDLYQDRFGNNVTEKGKKMYGERENDQRNFKLNYDCLEKTRKNILQFKVKMEIVAQTFMSNSMFYRWAM